MGKQLLKKVPTQTPSSNRSTNNQRRWFGQAETEIVLQNPARVQGLIVFLGTIFLTQIFLVLKRNKLKSSII
jgi:apocytochrome f